jgi:hypothetical protein
MIDGFPVIAAIVIRRRERAKKPPGYVDIDIPIFTCPWADRGTLLHRAFIQHSPAKRGAVVDDFERGQHGKILPERRVTACGSSQSPTHYWLEPLERPSRLLPRFWRGADGKLGMPTNWHLGEAERA